ncbi:unnamed protein product [Cuscuta campestris]|uniref:Uncharacterized protein n=1 Tax=Cuscuta campestris TaxID=132261 RepID=A0A484M5X3_9ASTE|nr:unnamed protein product [Cuscuta campestris]
MTTHLLMIYSRALCSLITPPIPRLVEIAFLPFDDAFPAAELFIAGNFMEKAIFFLVPLNSLAPVFKKKDLGGKIEVNEEREDEISFFMGIATSSRKDRSGT